MKKIIIFIIILVLAAIATSALMNISKNKNVAKSNDSPGLNFIDNYSKPNKDTKKTEQTPIKEYKVPILMYHYIRDLNDSNDKVGTNLSVSPKKFDEQLKWLRDNGYNTVNPDYLLTPYALTSKPIIITFDDGYKDAYTDAYPILKKYGFTATFYLITNYLEKNNPNYLSWDQVRELKNTNMNIGSHTISHPSLDKANDNSLTKEIENSKKIIEEKIGSAINDFCYPSGKYDTRTISALKKIGFKTAATVKSGVANQNSNLFELPRIRMTNNISLATTLNK